MEEDSVELIDYLRVIWKRKRLIIVGTLACMVTAGVVSFMLPKVYRASVIFLLEASKMPPEKIVSQNPKIFETYGKTYVGVIKNRTAMNQAIKEFQLDEEPYELALEGLGELISVKAVKKSKLLRLTVEFPNPPLAKDIANFLADKAIELNNTLNTTGSAENRDFIRDQMEVAGEAMDEAESKLLRFRKKAQLTVLRKKTDILLSRKWKIEDGLSSTEVDVAKNEAKLSKIVEINRQEVGKEGSKDFIKGQMEVAEEAMDEAESKLLRFRKKAQLLVLRKKIDILLSRKKEIENGISRTKVTIAENVQYLKKIEEEFAKRDRTIKLSRRLAENPLYQQSLAHLSESDVKGIFNLSMEVEVANPTYQHLEKALVTAIPTLGGLYAKRDSLQAEFKENISELNRLQIELANKEIESGRLQRDYNIARENHTMFLKKVDVIPTLSGLYAKRDFLQAELKENTSDLEAFQIELAKKEAERKRLQRTGDLTVAAYKMFVNKFEEITIQVASRSQDLRVLDPAVVPDKPFKPNKRANVLIAGVVGSMMFLFLAFFMEYLEKARKEQGEYKERSAF